MRRATGPPYTASPEATADDRADDLLPACTLHEVPTRPCPEGREDVLVVLVHGQDEHREPGLLLQEKPRRLHAVEAGHRQSP